MKTAILHGEISRNKSMKKHTKESSNAIRASVKTEMALPRMSKSARIAELKLDTARISERPKTVVPGTVDKLIPSAGPKRPEKAQVSIDGTDHGYRDLRIENSLTDEHGDEVKLKKGAHVQVTVMAENTVAIDPQTVAQSRPFPSKK
jgi:hypothetical protein